MAYWLIMRPLVVAWFVLALSASGQYRAAPTGSLKLTWDVLKWEGEIARAKAKSNTTEEESFSGYPLSKDSEVKRKQMSLRYAALENEDDLFRVLRTSKDASHRAFAATALGYSRHSPKQIDTLIFATSDADPRVRANARSALQSVVTGHSKSRSKVPAELLEP